MNDSSESPYAIYFSQAKELPPCYAPVQKAFDTSSPGLVRQEMTLSDIEYEVKSGRKCILVLTIADRESLSGIVNSLFLLKQEIKDRKVIPIIFLKFPSDKIEDLLGRSGVNDLLRFDTSAKAFSYKLNRQLKVLMHEVGHDSEFDVQLVRNQGSEHERKSKVSFSDSLHGPADFWLFPGKSFAKRVGAEWFIEMVGPGPAIGDWQKSDLPHRLGELDSWKWVPKAQDSSFVSHLGAWQFLGKKPRFNRKLHRWGFLSPRPDFSLVEKGEVIQCKFKLIDLDHLNVSGNSLHAQNLFEEMKKSFSLVSPLEEGSDAQFSWADQTDSGKLFASDWVEKQTPRRGAPEKMKIELEQIATGEEAMKPCGLKATLKGAEVELIEFAPAGSVLKLGISAGLLKKKEIVEIVVSLENLGSGGSSVLRGIVTATESDENGENFALVLMLQDSSEEFKKISAHLENRQDEVFLFFKKVKGLV